jgi:hypothetical protein
MGQHTSLTAGIRAPTEPRAPLFRDARVLPTELRIPRWFGALTCGVVCGGALLGGALERDHSAPEGIVHATFLGSALGYLTVSLADFYEHLRMEKVATGRWVGAQVVPVGETLNHLLTIGVLGSMLLLARPLAAPLDKRDVWVLCAPAVFLALGWRDEIVYHRRRSPHREDILHTVAHLAAGVMLASFFAWKLVDWARLRG